MTEEKVKRYEGVNPHTPFSRYLIQVIEDLWEKEPGRLWHPSEFFHLVKEKEKDNELPTINETTVGSLACKLGAVLDGNDVVVPYIYREKKLWFGNSKYPKGYRLWHYRLYKHVDLFAETKPSPDAKEWHDRKEAQDAGKLEKREGLRRKSRKEGVTVSPDGGDDFKERLRDKVSTKKDTEKAEDTESTLKDFSGQPIPEEVTTIKSDHECAESIKQDTTAFFEPAPYSPRELRMLEIMKKDTDLQYALAEWLQEYGIVKEMTPRKVFDKGRLT